jgi:hypothetical protein
MTDKRLDERITILEDIEEIKKVKAKYCYYMDRTRIRDLVELFTEDAAWDFRPLVAERLVGRQQIEELYKANNAVMGDRGRNCC